MSFAAGLAAYAAHTKQDIDTVLVKAVLTIGGGIIRDTPVDQGRLRNNWFFAEGSIPTQTTNALAADGSGSTARLNGITAGLKAGGI
ncbi:MAG: hypothetical protein EON92_03500, partial [Burkholderiales bacterium]